MADSRRLAVLKAIKAVLEGISGAGYNYPVAAAQHVSTDPTNLLVAAAPGNSPLYVVEPDPNGRRDFHPAMQVVEFVRGTITGRRDVGDVLDPNARAAAWEGMAADVEKALAADVTLGGLLYDLRLMPPQPFVGVGSPIVMVVVPFEARLHRTYGEP
jgi:hypothetical protein